MRFRSPASALAAMAAVTVLAADLAAFRPTRPDIHGEWVKYVGAGGDTVRAYLAFPERADAGPGVIVIHEIFGMSDWVRSVTDSLAVAGFVAIAPDLLSRRGGTDAVPNVRRAIGDLSPDSITVDLNATDAYLRGLKAVRAGDIGVIGFCWGGSQSFRYATNNAALKAAVVCYGGPPDAAAMARIHAPVFGVYGENDARVTATVPDAERDMRAAGKRYETTIYPGAGHGFLRTGEPPATAAKAWKDVVGFLRAALGK
jgi:carboxymethylenebutenolidase